MNATPERPAPTNPAKVTRTSDREVRIERVFNAPRDRVWKALTDPALVAQWWGRGNKLVIERMEVERGGHWRYVEHTDHGVHGFEGRYREVRPPDHISRTFEWDGMPGHVAVESLALEDLGDGRTRARVDVAVSHDRGLRRNAELRHGRRAQRELCGARSCPREILTVRRFNDAVTDSSNRGMRIVQRQRR
jgi:uncharacterized protein YndB with AHSA1/START domain